MKTLLVASLMFIIPFAEGDVKKPTEGGYDSDLVSFSKESAAGTNFYVVKLDRTDDRIKVKYFAKEFGGKTVGQRYASWKGSKNVIMYSSGAYMSDFDASQADIVGLTVDNGNVLNRTLITGRLGALVVTFPNGSIEVKNIADQNLTFSSMGEPIKFNLYDDRSLVRFIDWVKENKITVFQTHLLAHNNTLKVHANGDRNQARRRFLMSAKDAWGDEYYFIIHRNEAITLYQGTKSVFDYLRGEGYEVNSIINLDTGAQDVFRFYSPSGTVSGLLSGELELSGARNLMSFYYE